ncbi:MAG: Zn-dependent protease [Methanomassiliicoccaceae archaeon]|nr:Zn-dependent protease [Methanomassiliicoccaceae archaeon]
MRTINPVTGGRYSALELRDIAVSVLVLSVAFAVMFHVRGSELGMVVLLCMSAFVVCMSFVAHELAHKFVAQRYGAWAEYRMFPIGLMFALVMSFLGIIFAAPGVVYIRGQIDKRMNGIISAAGPATNLLLGAAALIAALMTTGLASTVFWIMATINAFFAIFNMLPITPFDGSKVYKWSVPVYLVMLAVAVALIAIVLFW